MFALRSLWIMLFLSALLALTVRGFVVPLTAGRTTTMWMPCAAIPPGQDQVVDDDNMNDDDESIMPDEIFFAMDETEQQQTKKSSTLASKILPTSTLNVQATWDQVTDKVQSLAQDERIQDLSAKATEFAKDVMGQLFKPVGEKLKQLKQEKEQEKAKSE